MTSSDKLNQNSKEKKSDAPNSKNSSPNSGMMGATAVLAAAKIDKKLSDKAHPILEHIKPDRLIKKKTLVDISLINQPLKGIIITSVINEADITYEICSTLAFNSPCKYFNDEPTFIRFRGIASRHTIFINCGSC